MAYEMDDVTEEGGKIVRRPWLGAAMQNIDSEMAENLNLPSPRGVLVAEVTAGGPAARAGLETGDVIVVADGNLIDDTSALGFRIATKKIGSSIEIEALHKGQRKKLTLALEAAPETQPRDNFSVTDNIPLKGAAFANLSPALAEELNLEFSSEGVAATNVDDSSPASQLGLKRGDILRGVNGKTVGTTAQLRDILKTPSRVWRISIERNGQMLTTVVAR